jgi:NAD(P)-dependent dehydrogenase (short-subunit alcohol dehydrogenase family)
MKSSLTYSEPITHYHRLGIAETVLIIGGSSGMGKGIAKSCVNAGLRVLIASRSEDKLAAAKAEVGGPAELVETVVLDASSDEDLEAFFTARPAGSISHVVVTVGPGTGAGDFVAEGNMAKARAQVEGKLGVQMAVAHFAARSKALRDGGSITFVSGALAKRPGKGSAVLAATNAAIDVLGRALANDLGPRIRVNTISPALVDTEMWAGMPPEVKAGMLAGAGKTYPAGRAGLPEDVGAAALFLIKNSFITGTVLDVDGGAAYRP